MELYIVNIEFKSDDSSYCSELEDLLISLGEVLCLTEHSYLLLAETTATVIRDAIKNSPYNIDRIFVAIVESPSAWRNLLSENSEIKSFLRHEQA